MTDERRRFYRIDDEVHVSIDPIEKSRVDDAIKDFHDNDQTCFARNKYNFEVEQHVADLYKIDHEMPELGRYLRVMEKQIERIAETVNSDDYDCELDKKDARISAQGIAFHSDKVIENDAMLKFKLMLIPSNIKLVIIARLVKIEAVADHPQGSQKISLDFEHIHEADREILIKHLSSRQITLIGNSRDEEI
ncbi:MAG: hypothetical protein ACI9LO_000270 [Planctomycetota bacterium]|jgi:hypothetical protein